MFIFIMKRQTYKMIFKQRGTLYDCLSFLLTAKRQRFSARFCRYQHRKADKKWAYNDYWRNVVFFNKNKISRKIVFIKKIKSRILLYAISITC